MADDGSKQGAVWPMPKFYFRVQFGNLKTTILFQEVSGLDTETQAIEYRHQDSAVFSTVKMPGLAKFGNVTMKKGVFVNDNTFWDWYNKIKMNTIHRETVTVELLNETENPVMTWTLQNAFPTKITGTDLKNDGNEVAIEVMEIAYEGLKIENK
ncbi:MAG: phage tail protein [Saprospiraceae bacterium]|nr:phage tail protein [Saprospiraceae bacterium]